MALIPITPPRAPIILIWSSLMLRSTSYKRRALVCETITGWFVNVQISSNPAGLMWARSSKMPSRSHSATSSRPKGVRPSAGEPAAAKMPPAAAALVRAWVSDSMRRPTSQKIRRRWGSSPTGSAPSMVRMNPIRSCACARWISANDRQNISRGVASTSV